MQERDWRTLLASIERQNCILCLGPDIFDDSPETRNRSLTRQLAAELLEDIDVPDPRMTELSRCELPAVAQQYAMKQGRSALEERAVDFYKRHADDESEVHHKLAQVPFYFALTSCHDALYENALRDAGRTPLTARYHFRGDKQDYVEMGTPRAPLLYSLYGSVKESQSLILTENDLLDFLVAIISENPRLPSSIRSELQRKAKSFLFLGFGIRHWYLRILLHVLKFNQQESRSFALETLSATESELEQSIIFYRTGYSLDIFRCDIREFVAELHERSRNRGLTVETTNVVPGPIGSMVGPKVFISHTREDGEQASALYSAFQKSGFEVWLDSEQLEGGELWDSTIRSRIAEADYFVVLNSDALHRKKRGYINAEINLALRQQDEMRGVRYITPVRVDQTEVIPELSRFQAPSARDASEIDRLISGMKREFQLRGRMQ